MLEKVCKEVNSLSLSLSLSLSPEVADSCSYRLRYQPLSDCLNKFQSDCAKEFQIRSKYVRILRFATHSTLR